MCWGTMAWLRLPLAQGGSPLECPGRWSLDAPSTSLAFLEALGADLWPCVGGAAAVDKDN